MLVINIALGLNLWLRVVEILPPSLLRVITGANKVLKRPCLGRIFLHNTGGTLKLFDLSTLVDHVVWSRYDVSCFNNRAMRLY